MAKKKAQDDAPNPSSVQNRDIMQRLNYLYQASMLLGGSQPPPPPLRLQRPSVGVVNGKKLPSRGKHKAYLKRVHEWEGRTQRRPTTCADLSRCYVRSMRAIGRKTNVRMDPAVKRTLCKTCSIVLVPGNTAKVRIRTSSTHGNVVSHYCMSCGDVRRFPAPPEAEPEAVVDSAEDAANVQEQTVAAPDHAHADMMTDPTPGASSSSILPARSRQRPSMKKRRPPPKVPPLFARRDAGHIVFRGNERLQES